MNNEKSTRRSWLFYNLRHKFNGRATIDEIINRNAQIHEIACTPKEQTFLEKELRKIGQHLINGAPRALQAVNLMAGLDGYDTLLVESRHSTKPAALNQHRYKGPGNNATYLPQ